MNFMTERLVRKAQKHLRSTGIIPLVLYAKLVEAGVDINELERTTRNG